MWKILWKVGFKKKWILNLRVLRKFVIPGHSTSLQLCVCSRSSFGTSSQPWSHVLVLVCWPGPHVALQLVQSAHVDISRPRIFFSLWQRFFEKVNRDMNFIKLTISIITNLCLNKIIWWGKRTYSTNASSTSDLFSVTTGFTTFRIWSPYRVYLKVFYFLIGWINICEIRVTWWFLNTILRWYFAIYDCELSISVRICFISWIRAVTCIRIVHNINIWINPERCEIFQNTVDGNFLDVNLNSNKG